MNNGIARCIDKDGDGCFEWDDQENCNDNEHCDDSLVQCIKGCKSECEDGQMNSTPGGSKICKDKDGDGCFEWVDVKPCNPGEKYDKEKDECVSVCGNDCKPFSIVLLPDTQYYTRTYADASKSAPKLRKQIDWINNNQSEYNIKAVINLGDMTDTNHPDSYQYNVDVFGTLKYNLPWLPSGGNHDYLNGSCNDGGNSNCPYSKLRSADYTFSRSASKFSKTIKASTFEGKSWFGGFYAGANAYITFTAAGTEFVVISLEFNPRKGALCWAENIIKNHPNAKIILETHSYLTNNAHTSSRKNGRYSGGRAGNVLKTFDTANNFYKYNINFVDAGSAVDLYNELVAKYNNIIMIASGHTTGSVFRITKGNGDNWLSEVLVDYQQENTGNGKCENSSGATSKYGSGGGWLRVLTFDPLKLTITSETISATEEKSFLCTIYPKSPTEKPDKVLTPEDEKNATNNHAFVANFDFLTPVEFKETDSNMGYLFRTVNQISSGNQETPAIAMNRDTGDHVIVWADDAYDSNKNDTDGAGNKDIFARVFCSSGCDYGKAQFTINKTTAGNQIHPDVAADKNGNFVAVWTNAANNNIYMCKFSMDGKELFPEKQVNTSGNADNASIAMDDTGNFIVTWQRGNDIDMRGFDASGAELFGQKTVSSEKLSASGQRNLPDIAMDKDGNFVIAWEDDADGDGKYDIAARGFHKDGSERLKQFVANKNTSNQQRTPAIGMNRSGVFYIAWKDDSDGNEVYQTRLSAWNPDGSVRIQDQIAGSSQQAHSPDVCVRDDGSASVTWAAEKYATDNAAYKKVVLFATVDGSETGILKNASLVTLRDKEGDAGTVRASAGAQDQPAIACSDAKRFVITWHDDVDDNNSYEVKTRGFY